MSGTIADAPAPLAVVIPSYAYQEYSDDQDIQAFVASFNTLAQSYLDWFNSTSLAVYIAAEVSATTIDATAGNPIIVSGGNLEAEIIYAGGLSGLLLDWCATGIYGIARPVLSSLSTKMIAGLNSAAINTRALNGNTFLQSGTATAASDDIYKRVLTWWLYRGDGQQFSIGWLRRRVARFIYGANGSDISLNYLQNISIAAQPLSPPSAPVLESVAGGTIAATTYYAKIMYVTAEGTTLPSAESSFAVAADYLLTVASPPAVTGATGWNVAISTSSGTETIQNTTPIAIGTSFTEPTTGMISGAAVPTANTSNPPGNFIVTIPSGTSSQFFQQCVANGVLALPFQNTFTIVVG